MTIGTIYRQFIDNSIEEGTMMEHQQKNVFVLFLGIVFLCIPTYTFSIPFPGTLYYYMNAIQFAALLVFTILYFTKKININTAFSSILIVIHMETSIALNPQLHSRSATYIKRNGLLIRKITIKSSRPFQCAYHPLTP